jgi:hypothetical protein
MVGTFLTVPPDRGAVLAADPGPTSLGARQTSQVGLSATLQRLLVEHVYVTGLLVKTILDGRQDQLQPSIDAVDTNSRALGDAIGQAQGPDVREAFLTAWRRQIGLYIDYAFGAASRDDAKKGIALASLNDARGTIDAALTSGNPRLSPGLVAELLRPQVQGIVGAVDAFAAGDTAGAYTSLQIAAAHVPVIADPLAEGLAANEPPPAAPQLSAQPSAPSVTAQQPTPPAATSSDARGCAVSGPASAYATTLDDFGLRGASFVKQQDAGYWGGGGYLIGFERGDGDAFQSSPWGGYLIAGVIIATDEREASEDLKNAMQGWTTGWQPYLDRSLPDLGDQAAVAARLTPWEITASQPMSEVFLAVRQCNAVAHILLAVMPEHRPVDQATRYARLMIERMEP